MFVVQTQCRKSSRSFMEVMPRNLEDACSDHYAQGGPEEHALYRPVWKFLLKKVMVKGEFGRNIL